MLQNLECLLCFCSPLRGKSLLCVFIVCMFLLSFLSLARCLSSHPLFIPGFQLHFGTELHNLPGFALNNSVLVESFVPNFTLPHKLSNKWDLSIWFCATTSATQNRERYFLATDNASIGNSTRDTLFFCVAESQSCCKRALYPTATS